MGHSPSTAMTVACGRSKWCGHQLRLCRARLWVLTDRHPVLLLLLLLGTERAVESMVVLGRRVLPRRPGEHGAGGEIPAGCSVSDKAAALGIRGAIEMSTMQDTMLLSAHRWPWEAGVLLLIKASN